MNVDSFTLPHDFIEKLNTVLDSFAGVGQESNRSSNEALIKEIKKNQAELMQFVEHNSEYQAKIWDQLDQAAASSNGSSSVQDPEQEERKGPASQAVRTVIDRNSAVAATQGG